MHPFEEALRDLVAEWMENRGASHGDVLDALEMVSDSVKEDETEPNE